MSKVRLSKSGWAAWWCPGCDQAHVIPTQGPQAWGFNGSVESPTLMPSVLVHGVPAMGRPTCHSFVTDGKVQFLGDCTHPLAGQTVEIPPFPGELNLD